jgi:NADH-quinone oxidoreductase subunit M
MQQYLLTILILVPVVGALLAVGHGFVSYRRETHYRWIALLFSLLTFALSLLLLSNAGSYDSAAFRFEQNVPWIGSIGTNYHLGVDGISLWLVLLTTLLVPISILSSWHAVEKRTLSYYAFLLVLEAAMIGVFVSLDLLVFYLFFEASLVPMFFLIGIWGGERRIYAAVKFFIYTAVGSLLMLVAIIALYYIYGSFDYVTILNAMRTGATPLPPNTEFLLFLAFAFAFCIKVPLFPFHTWLPDAHTEAPTAGSVIRSSASSTARSSRWCSRMSKGSSPTPPSATWGSSCSASSHLPNRGCRARSTRCSITAFRRARSFCSSA